MPTDPRKLKPTALCELVNSTPLGEVLTVQTLRQHRTKAGRRIGDGQTVDLLRYTAWLCERRHTPPEMPADALTPAETNLPEVARGVAEHASRSVQVRGHGQKLTLKQERLIAALLTEPTYAKAAEIVGIHEATLYRWLQLDTFRDAYRLARKQVVDGAIARLQAASGEAVETLLSIARSGKRDSDRLRAATGILKHALGGLAAADLLSPEEPASETDPMVPADVVRALTDRLTALIESELSTAEKSKLSVPLSNALLKAIGIDVLDQRLQAVERVLKTREESIS